MGEEKFEIIISACLLGIPCRYSGKAEINEEALKLFLEGKALLVCPEVASGQKTPRPACEIVNGDGHDVLRGRAKVVDKDGNDHTVEFINGARMILDEIVSKHEIKKALLKSKSPSCGVDNIYSGKFDGSTIKGCGVFSALLKENGIYNIKEL